MTEFEKVGKCLDRYALIGMYYGRFEVGGKEMRCKRDIAARMKVDFPGGSEVAITKIHATKLYRV